MDSNLNFSMGISVDVSFDFEHLLSTPSVFNIKLSKLGLIPNVLAFLSIFLPLPP